MLANNYMCPSSTPVDPVTGLPYTMPGSTVGSFAHAGGYQPPCQQGFPGSASMHCGSQPLVEWVRCHPRDAKVLSGKAVFAGSEGHDRSPLWVIRAQYCRDLIPGKLAIDHGSAYIAYGGKEHAVEDIEVCCIAPENYRWFPSAEGRVVPSAVVGGRTEDGETLYIGRGHYEKSLTPGKIHPSQGVMYISYAGKEIALRDYEVLCIE